MAYLKLRLYEKIEEKFGQEFREEFEEQWGTYLDDCFINWDTNIFRSYRSTQHPQQPTERN